MTSQLEKPPGVPSESSPDKPSFTETIHAAQAHQKNIAQAFSGWSKFNKIDPKTLKETLLKYRNLIQEQDAFKTIPKDLQPIVANLASHAATAGDALHYLRSTPHARHPSSELVKINTFLIAHVLNIMDGMQSTTPFQKKALENILINHGPLILDLVKGLKKPSPQPPN